MATRFNAPTFYPRRLSVYVPAMQFASDVNNNGVTRVSFGSPANTGAATVLSAQSIATAGSTTTTLLTNNELDGTWGRVLKVVASGAATSTVTIDGWDYLNQPITEVLTLNGATIVNGKKAFKWIRKVTWGATGGTTINLGTLNVFGLPYKAVGVYREIVDGALGTTGTLTAPVLTDPQTSTTGDPRGTYTCNATPDGTKVIEAVFDFINDVNSSGNGGLHGIAHYAA